MEKNKSYVAHAATDVYDQDGCLLLAKGKPVTESLLKLLAKRNIDIKMIISEETEGKNNNEKNLEKTLNENVQEFLLKIKGIDQFFYKKVPELIEKIMINIRENHYFNILLNILCDRIKWVYSHSINVSLLSSFIGYKLCLSENDVEKIAIGSLFHDIGQILIPSEILNKSSALTKNECEIIKMHPHLGFD
ncbi:MAG: HD domain-containing protein [Peptococcaceae bacterium]|jgi:HD-GYP domain-containing protein (c-di-GMP phosphodiesterase class II)|nr:HD domain-containing protein [Peptococcaceae bacterium]MDH7525446.1 HD domain-containing protein [Peptococcaceae bacterium]